jgi:hypothetical protein
VTDLLDRSAGASTLSPLPPPIPSSVSMEEDFYLYGPPASDEVSLRVVAPDPTGRLDWLASAVERQLNDLLRLRPGWDGRRARPLTQAAVLRAVEIFACFGEHILPPQIFPLPDGGVQLEWHVGSSVEIEVDAEGEAHLLVADDSGEIVINEELSLSDAVLIARVRTILEDLADRLSRVR